MEKDKNISESGFDNLLKLYKASLEELDSWRNFSTVLSVKYKIAFEAIRDIVLYGEMVDRKNEYPVQIAREAYDQLEEE